MINDDINFIDIISSRKCLRKIIGDKILRNELGFSLYSEIFNEIINTTYTSNDMFIIKHSIIDTLEYA